MPVKDMRRSDWKRILKRKYTDRDFSSHGLRGKQSLLLIEDVTEPLLIDNSAGRILIADRKHAWLQIALDASHIWITAMFDANGAFLQAYFDITAGNSFEDPQNPTFSDMYLDVVLTAGGSIHILDRDELDAALKAGLISKTEHKEAVAHCSALCEYLSKEKTPFIAYCKKAYQELKQILEDDRE